MVVFFYDWFYIEISILIFGQMFEILVIFKYKVFSHKSINNFFKCSQLVFLLSLISILILKIYFDFVIKESTEIPSDVIDSFFLIGWILISLIFSGIVFFFLIVNWNLFVILKITFKKMKNKYLETRKIEIYKDDLHDASSFSSRQQNSKIF